MGLAAPSPHPTPAYKQCIKPINGHRTEGPFLEWDVVVCDAYVGVVGLAGGCALVVASGA
jgi:hypothetical protein